MGDAEGDEADDRDQGDRDAHDPRFCLPVPELPDPPGDAGRRRDNHPEEGDGAKYD